MANGNLGEGGVSDVKELEQRMFRGRNPDKNQTEQELEGKVEVKVASQVSGRKTKICERRSGS